MKKSYEGLARLLVLLVIIPLVSWCFGVSPTINQWKKYRKSQSEISLFGDGKQSPSSVKLYEDLLNNGDLLKIIFPEIQKNGIHIDLYIPYQTEIRSDITLRSAEIVFRGEYTQLLKTIYHLEHEFPQISLRSVEFVSTKNQREKKLQLRASLIVQQLTYTEK